MKVFYNSENKIVGYNKNEDAKIVGAKSVFIEDFVLPKVKEDLKQRQTANYYLNEDLTIRYEIVNVPIIPLTERESRSLDRDEMAVQQLLLLLDIQLNTSI